MFIVLRLYGKFKYIKMYEMREMYKEIRNIQNIFYLFKEWNLYSSSIFLVFIKISICIEIYDIHGYIKYAN